MRVCFLPFVAACAALFVFLPGSLAQATAVAWGAGNLGQLGNGGWSDSPTPNPVSCLSGVTAVCACGSHSIAVKADGSVWAWGENGSGQLGDETTENRSIPVRVKRVASALAVSTGQHHGLALERDGSVWSWGYSDFGQLGFGAIGDLSSPGPVPGLSGVTAVSAGEFHSLALAQDGTVWAWGRDIEGELGDGRSVDRIEPAQVAGLTDVISISAGGFHNLALKKDGTVWAWGYNGSGQLGDGNATSSALPVRVLSVDSITGVAAGEYQSLARKSDGSVWSWGLNNAGQLGDGTKQMRFSPVQVPGLADASSVAAGCAFSAAVTSSGTVWTWGDNSRGQLGDGTVSSRSYPVKVAGLSHVSLISGGTAHAIAVVGAAQILVFRGQPASVLSGAPFAAPMTVEVHNSDGTIAGAAVGHVALSIKGGSGTVGAVLDGTVVAPLVNGTATFASISIQTPGKGYVLVATCTDLKPVESRTFDVTAKPSWSRQIGASTPGGVCIADGLIYVGSGDGKLFAFSLSDGSTVQGFPVDVSAAVGAPVSLRSRPAVYYGRTGKAIYVTTDQGNTVRVKPDGQVAWHVRPLPGPACGTPAVTPTGEVFVTLSSGTGPYDTYLFKLDEPSGQPLCLSPFLGSVVDATPGDYSPAISNRYVYADAGAGDALFVLNQDNLTPRASFFADEDALPPYVSGTSLYLATRSGKVFKMDAVSLSIDMSFGHFGVIDAGQTLTTAPFADEQGSLYVGTAKAGVIQLLPGAKMFTPFATGDGSMVGGLVIDRRDGILGFGTAMGGFVQVSVAAPEWTKVTLLGSPVASAPVFDMDSGRFAVVTTAGNLSGIPALGL